MQHRAVIFDLDGTLLDTLADLTDALNRVLRDKGFPTHPPEAVRYFVGSGSAKLVSRALPAEKRNDVLAADCLSAFRRQYNRNWDAKTRPYKGVTELLDALTAGKIDMAVCTNKPQNFAELCIEKFLPSWKFAVILGQRDGVALKPDPAGAHEITRRLDLPAAACLFLGDSDIDMKTALNANMFPVGAAWGFRSEKELRASGAIEVINRPGALLEFVGA